MENNQIKRLVDNYSNIAREAVTVEIISQTVYVFGSEKAIAKITAKYRKNTKSRHGYSDDLKTYFFAIDLH